MKFIKINKIIDTKREEEMYDIKIDNENHNFFANNFLTHNSGGDARASLGLTDTFEEFKEAKDFKEKYPLASRIAMKLEGGIRHKGSHAAAMVVSEMKINKYAPTNKIGGIVCIEWEKQLVEDMKLVKFDILGLKTLTVLSEACKTAKIELPKTFDDPKVYEKVFKNGNTNGVFQFCGPGMQKFIRGLNIKSFGELSDATTLYRPGALHCLCGNSVARTFKDKKFSLRKLFSMQEKGEKLPKIMNKFGKYSEIEKVHKNGVQQLFELSVEGYGTRWGDRKIKATKKHKFLTDSGWKKLEDLNSDDEIYILKHRSHPSWCKGTKGIVKAWNKGKKMNFTKEQTEVQIKNIIKGGMKTRFKKGSIPHNKGKKGWGHAMWLKYPDKHPNVILNKNGRISYKQKELFAEIKKRFKSAKMNFSIKTDCSFRFAYVAVPSLKLDFEYDGEYWHSSAEAKKSDRKRDKELKKIGWKTIRINKNNFRKFKEDLKNGKIY